MIGHLLIMDNKAFGAGIPNMSMLDLFAERAAAFVVDLICHSISSQPSALATSTASTVLPVPGSPLIKSGRSNWIAALTATRRSSVAT